MYRKELLDQLKRDYRTLITYANSSEINMLKGEGFTEIEQTHHQYRDLTRIMEVSDKQAIMAYMLPRFKVEMKITILEGEFANSNCWKRNGVRPMDVAPKEIKFS